MEFQNPKISALLAPMTLCAVAVLCGCSADTNVAGTFIETNTGNKILIETNTGNLARVVLATDDLDIATGDTLQIFRTQRDTTGDTIRVNNYYLEKIAEEEEITSGFVSMNGVPEGNYDSLAIIPTEGEPRTIAIDLKAVEGKSYFYGPTGLVENKRASIILPEDFEDLAQVDEVFENVPFVITLDNSIKNPCLIDAAGASISLDRVAGSNQYWGQMPQVIFAKSGSIEFDIIDECQDSDSLGLLLGRHVEHFDSYVPSDSAVKALESRENLYGGALWTSSTDSWYYINDFKPFVDDYNMTASLWINVDNTQQAKSYTRILSAKKDSIGFIVQQRADRKGVNLRLDAGSGDAYNQLFGTAEILDGTWHNYSFRINKDSVTIFVDGKLLQDAPLISRNGFSAAFNPAVGGDKPNLVGGIDEVFFFDGTQSNNWMRLFYALQKQVIP